MYQKICIHANKWWYTVCFLLFGIIDQRRGSASGSVQMIFANLTGVVMALLLLPSIAIPKDRRKPYLLWTPICVCLGIIACIIGTHYWKYNGQWISAVLNVMVWSYLLIYLVRERTRTEFTTRVRQPFFWMFLVLVILMLLSVHEGIRPLWYLLIYGGFALIGIPEDKTRDFFDGMLNGIMIWFFIQQIIAFGFRPFDYIRYQGMYSGVTQNGLFYMVAFCAFLLKWFDSREKKQKWFVRFFYFLMSAGLICFTILTGSKAAMFGIGAVTAVTYIGYDLLKKKTFYSLLLHSLALVLCVVLTFPVTYMCVRYLPTILHHPIWFEGEYREGESVCSYDPWNSEKYISFEEVVYNDVGRMLEIVGIAPDSLIERIRHLTQGLPVHAAELNEQGTMDTDPGSSPDNPFNIEELNGLESSTDARKVIYTYFWNHLNFRGHDKEHSGFWISPYYYYGHAHNLFLQVAYDYGIIPGIIFVLIYLYSLYRAFLLYRKENAVCLVYLLAVLCFGMVEMEWNSGQIAIPIMMTMFYFAGRNGKEVRMKP